MSRYRYLYTGSESVNLPEHSITTDPDQPEKVYESDTPITHPLFQLIAEKSEPKKGK